MNRQVMRMEGCRWTCGAMVACLFLVADACVAQQPKGINPSPKEPMQEEPEQIKCPPDSLTVSNGSQTPKDISYSCEGGDAGFVTVLSGKSVTFRESCGSPAPDNCIDCGVVAVYGPNGEKLFSCDLQAAYLKAYGIDLAAMGFTMTEASMPKKIYNADGDVIRMRHWAIPIINEDGAFVNWEFTTIKPNFSVEDGEVVIRDNRGRVIGGRAGITLGK